VSTRATRLLWLLIAAGSAARVAVAFATYGSVVDMGSLERVASVLAHDPLDLYGRVNHAFIARWPYPGGFLPLAAAARGLANLTGLPFHGIVQLPSIAADAGLAWLVQHYLGRRGADERVRLAAAALVALGPSFAAISGYHGQIDSLAILPAAAALLAWDRDGPRRALVAGLLIGLGASLKTVPIVVVLALLPTARSARECVLLAGAAVAVPLLSLAPFLAVHPGDVKDALSYTGLPGVGGLSLAVQPEYGGVWLQLRPPHANGLSRLLLDHGSLFTLLPLAAAGALLTARRVEPARAATILWLVVYCFAAAFFFQYLVWGLPFFIMAGYLREAALLQAAVLVPTALFYLGPWQSDLPQYVYTPLMIATWIGLLAWLAASVRRASMAPRAAV
jgi:hypothetical protein